MACKPYSVVSLATIPKNLAAAKGLCLSTARRDRNSDSTIGSNLEKSLSCNLLQPRLSRTLKGMEVRFTPEQQAQLAQIATKAGTDPERLVTNVVARYLDEEARFLAAVEKGIAAAERGEFIEEEEMDARLEAMFNP